jgi:predicted Ser/Thr protein kinase
LFKLTLESRGYTFVAKGTVEAFVPKLKHEARIYHHLAGTQGDLIPVYLGGISLARTYFLDFGVRITFMLLMSWTGEWAETESISSMGLDLDVEKARAAGELRDRGVEHRDMRPPNVLWNHENKRVMLVDFERSEILKQVPVLQEISPNRKRRNLHPNKETSFDKASCREFVGLASCEWAVRL